MTLPFQILIAIVLTLVIVGTPFSVIYRKGLFGWNNVTFIVKELVKMYSHVPSFFSYKRFQTGVAFFIFTQGAMYSLKEYVKTVNDFLLWCIPVLLVCGYTLNHTQKEKLNDNKPESESTTELEANN